MTTVGAEIELGEVVGFEEELCLDVQDGKDHSCDEEGSGDEDRSPLLLPTEYGTRRRSNTGSVVRIDHTPSRLLKPLRSAMKPLSSALKRSPRMVAATARAVPSLLLTVPGGEQEPALPSPILPPTSTPLQLQQQSRVSFCRFLHFEPRIETYRLVSMAARKTARRRQRGPAAPRISTPLRSSKVIFAVKLQPMHSEGFLENVSHYVT